MSQYSRLTGKKSALLPWGQLQYVQDNMAILFSDSSVKDSAFLYDLHSHELQLLHRPIPVVPVGADGLMRGIERSQLVNGSYSADFRNIAFVRDYDLYVMDTTTGKERRLTTGGNDKLMNGRPDWVYPEELDQRDAFWWSPDGKKIAYLQYDESPVSYYPIVHDKTLDVSLEMQPYPAAGTPNPIVKLFVLNVADGKTIEVKTASSSDVYVFRAKWHRYQFSVGECIGDFA
jgi:dipeptidyl-peptidase-4